MKTTNQKGRNGKRKERQRKEKEHEFVVCINVIKTLFE
jgi:hypothetical protein